MPNPGSSSSSNVPLVPTFNPIPTSHIPGQQQSTDLRWRQNNPPLHPTHAEPDTPNSRPSTAPAYHDISQLNKMLPPKRDLPFSKPAPKRTRLGASDQTATKKRPSLPPPLRQPASPGNNQERRQSARAEALTHSEFRITDSQTQSPPPTQPHPDAITTITTSPKHPPLQLPRVASGRRTQVLVPHDSPADLQSNINNTNSVNQNTQEHDPISRPTPKTSEKVEDHLAMYLTSPTPERIAFLENWMCELIEDDKFMALCQDVEATWRRFAFGNGR